MLMDHRDAMSERFARTSQSALATVDAQRAAIRLHHAVRDAHERRLPRPVFAQQSVYSSGAEYEVRAIERDNVAELLANTAELEWRFGACYSPVGAERNCHGIRYSAAARSAMA